MAGLLLHKLLAILCDKNMLITLMQSGFWWSSVACTLTHFFGSFTWHLMLHTIIQHLTLTAQCETRLTHAAWLISHKTAV
jgi:hypothetical protein